MIYSKYSLVYITLAMAVLVTSVANAQPSTPGSAQGSQESQGESTADKLKDKFVIANVDKYSVYIRIGGQQKEIKPRKATVLAPRQYPFKFELFNGTRGNASWEEKEIAEAGIYTFRFPGNGWVFTKFEKKASTNQTNARSTSRSSSGRTSYRRTTGSSYRTTSSRSYGYPVLRRMAVAGLGIYKFVRDEEDRDLIRAALLGEAIDEEKLASLLEGIATQLPQAELLQMQNAIRDLESITQDDLGKLDDLTDGDFDRLGEELGNHPEAELFNDLESDFAEAGIGDLGDADIGDADLGGADLGGGDLDVGGGDLDIGDGGDLDLGDLDAGDVDLGDLDLGEGGLGGTLDDVDLGDLAGEGGDLDLGEVGGELFGDDFDIDQGFDGGGPLFDGGGGGLLDGGGLGGGGGFDGGGGGVLDGGGFDIGGGGFDGGGFGGGGFGGGGFGGGGFGGGGFGGGGFGGGGFGGGLFD